MALADPKIRAIVAANIRAERARWGVTQDQIAEALGITQPQVSRRLRGAVAFKLEELERIAPLFHLEAQDLLAAPVIRNKVA